MRFALLAMVVALTSGCLFGNDVRMSAEHAQFIKNVGVVSLLDKYPFIHHAAQEPKDIIDRIGILKGWEINRTIEALMVERLNKKGFNARTVPAPDSLKAVYDNSWSHPQPERIRETLYALGQQRGLDMLVVVYRQKSDDFISDSRENVRGYGIFRTHRVEPHIYASVHVEAVDVRKQYVVGQADGTRAEKLELDVWQDDFADGKGPVLMSKPAVADFAAELAEITKLATMLAAQEAGLSN